MALTTRPETCGIPPTSSTPCDLAWGHADEFHSSQGFRFRVRDYDEEHARRQKETGNLPKPVFHFSLSYDTTLNIEQIWPDGDAPENPTLDDVMAVIVKCGGKRGVLEDWGLAHDLELNVSDGKHSRKVGS